VNPYSAMAPAALCEFITQPALKVVATSMNAIVTHDTVI